VMIGQWDVGSSLKDELEYAVPAPSGGEHPVKVSERGKGARTSLRVISSYRCFGMTINDSVVVNNTDRTCPIILWPIIP
jgi:hypothetical protein